ncbi:helix-turn-helix domain-containing protein [Gluconobacter sp. P1C6_b]|uniref:helix-turn-helix domain-containing protein n=1 Tax=Gluconobacter sp. P1C6_b TaxID=2762619 RepID=UPI001C04925F|nr:helix-turn-helix domain-containing protein [Gluconobacter sp. P1C6_b]
MIDNGFTAQVIHCYPGAYGMVFTEFSHPRMEAALEEWAASGMTPQAIKSALYREILGARSASGVHIEVEPEPSMGGHTVTAFIVNDHKPRRHMTPDEKREIAEWHRAGFKCGEIAEAVGRQYSTVDKYLRRAGLTGRAGA